MAARQFTAEVVADGRKRVVVRLPFTADEAWGTKPRHHLGGTINGKRFRAVIEPGGGDVFVLGSAWRRDYHIAVGDIVTVVLEPEGPLRESLAADVAAALEADPAAGEFFDSIAQFYRKAYLRWVDATKRRPEQRAQRIAEMVALLAAGMKERPR